MENSLVPETSTRPSRGPPPLLREHITFLLAPLKQK